MYGTPAPVPRGSALRSPACTPSSKQAQSTAHRALPVSGQSSAVHVPLFRCVSCAYKTLRNNRRMIVLLPAGGERVPVRLLSYTHTSHCAPHAVGFLWLSAGLIVKFEVWPHSATPLIHPLVLSPLLLLLSPRLLLVAAFRCCAQRLPSRAPLFGLRTLHMTLWSLLHPQLRSSSLNSAAKLRAGRVRARPASQSRRTPSRSRVRCRSWGQVEQLGLPRRVNGHHPTKHVNALCGGGMVVSFCLWHGVQLCRYCCFHRGKMVVL
jgi:hypothetical protein